MAVDADVDETVDPNSTTFSGPNSLSKDAQLVELAKIYKTQPCLWNEKEMAYRFANRRREALENMLQELNKKFKLKLSKRDLEKEISRLRKICTYEKNQKIVCQKSKRSYKPKFPYYEHLAFAEIDVRPFECSVCGNLLASLSQYTIHIASHDGSLPFKCIVCGRGFQLATNLTVHLRRHAQDYYYSCEVCSKSFATTTELKTHMLQHTGEKPHVCDICGKRYQMRREFKEHMVRHENRGPGVKCTICPKAFYNNRNLREHMAVHRNVRDKICDVCNKGFTSRKLLRQHKHVHNKEKKFVCKICGKRFAQFAGLSGHVKSHGICLSATKSNNSE
ncbi:PREDICTED: myoneurin-like [Rhagoletis zephyria]|uniref:myoneurin-like n=1 Tax=Rhagoletis zephyria TaxID=28612 RepID=UPI00081193DE|nr:PREDICTED: myoneurin-like [Rhagoletis zephyria]